MDLLKRFYDEKNMREEVFTFIRSTLDEVSLQMVKTNEDTKNLSKAYTALDKVEAKLRAKYEHKLENKQTNRAL